MQVMLCLALVFSISGCGGNTDTTKEETTKEETKSITVTDQAGREVTLDKPATKVVSCYYISSYAMLALDNSEALVGIEKKADTRPIYKMTNEELLNLPQVGTLKEINIEAIAEIQPDVVLLPLKLQDQVDTLTDLGIQVIVVNPETQDQLIEMLTLIGKVCGKETEAKALTDYYQEKMDFLETLTTDEKPSVYMGSNSSFLETATDEMYQGSLITTAGGTNASSAIEGNYWTEISYETLLSMNPEVIIIPSGAAYSVEDVMNDSQLANVQAVQNNAVYQMPKGIEEWDSPVPSGILGTMWLASILHEEAYPFDTFKEDVIAFYQDFYGFTLEESSITK